MELKFVVDKNGKDLAVGFKSHLYGIEINKMN